MDMTFTELPGVTKVSLAGRLDTSSVDRVEIQFTAGVVPKGQHTVIDLSEVSFIASLGIRMLLTVARSLVRKGAKLALFGAAPPVMEIIETTALNEIIPVLATEAEAIELVTA